MKHVDFEGANVTLTRPPGAEDILPLRVRVTRCGSGHYVTQSMWRPSQEDIENLQGGGLIAVTYLHHGHPPMAVETVAPETLACGG